MPFDATEPAGSEREHPVPPNAVRVWRGFRNPNLTVPEFFDKLAHIFIPVAAQSQRLYGLTAYLPAVLPAEKPAGLPDEVALVFYESQDAYNSTSQYPLGRAYSALHGIVFSLSRSESGFPVAAGDVVQIGTPYHIFEDAVDWQTASVELWAGMRRQEVSVDKYAAGLTKLVKDLRSSPGTIRGAILCAAKDWLVYWQCSDQPVSERSLKFDEVATVAFTATATPIAIPPLFTDMVDQVRVQGGEFFNTQFPRRDSRPGQ